MNKLLSIIIKTFPFVIHSAGQRFLTSIAVDSVPPLTLSVEHHSKIHLLIHWQLLVSWSLLRPVLWKRLEECAIPVVLCVCYLNSGA